MQWSRAGGSTSSVVEWVAPLRAAEMTTGVGSATALVGNSALTDRCPAGTATFPGVATNSGCVLVIATGAPL
jgi:hypothetical protein